MEQTSKTWPACSITLKIFLMLNYFTELKKYITKNEK